MTIPEIALGIYQGGNKMKKMLILSLTIGMILAIGSKAFAMLEKPSIISQGLSSEYQNTKALL